VAKKTDPIAVFDSGVGGISVLRELVSQMPQENFLYYGDSANAPYGTRPTQQVRELCTKVVEHLLTLDIKALVIACNTATAAAIDHLRAAYPDLIIVGIEPALKLAAARHPGGTVGVIATPVTLREEKFRQLEARCSQNCKVISIPAPGLADLVEEGRANSPESEALLRCLLAPYRDQLDALVLGCTHYPFAAATIASILSPSTELVDGGEGTARETKHRLELAGLLSDGPGQIRILSSADDPKMIARSWDLFRG
jgi:glutamate racemase